MLGGVGLFLLRDRFAPQPLPHRAANLELPPAAPAPENSRPVPPAAGVAAAPVDQTAVGFLGAEVSAGPYHLRLPSGMESVRQERSEFGKQIFSWAGSVTRHGKRSTITIHFIDLQRDPAPDGLDSQFENLQKLGRGAALQKVLVMGKPFIRMSSQFRAGGTLASGIKFFGYDGRRYVTLGLTCPEPEGSPAYKLLESSRLSIH